jgi:hypothetical protein
VNMQLGEIEALRWLKDAALAEPEVPVAVEARVWARVSCNPGVLSVGQLGAASPLGDPGTLSSGAWRRVLASRLAIWSAPALVVGAAAGFTGHAALVEKVTRTVYVDRVVAEPLAANTPSATVESLALEPETPATEDATQRLRAAPVLQATSVSAAASANAEPRSESALGRERAVLDPARAALAAGEPARALDRVRRHRREFPNGILSEEREAIAINALVALGDFDQATKRAAAFRARYPQSLMTHSVDAAMAAVKR